MLQQQPEQRGHVTNENEPPFVFTTTYLTGLAKKLEVQLKLVSASRNAAMEQGFVRGLSRETAAAWLFTHKKEELVKFATAVCPKGSAATCHFKADYCRAIVAALFDPTPETATPVTAVVGSSRVDLQACKLEYSIVSPK